MNLPKVLVWDKNCPKEFDTFKQDSGHTVFSHIRSKISRRNLERLLGHFDSIAVVSSLKALTNQLLQCNQIDQLYVIFIFACPTSPVSDPNLQSQHDSNDILQFISSHLVHRSHYLVVLSDATTEWSELGRLGAHDVGHAAISDSDFKRYVKRVNQIVNARKSRSGQLKLLLGLSEQILPCGVLRAFSPTYQIFLTPNMPIPLNDDLLTKMRTAISSWDFHAHDFSSDDLVVAAFVMLKHALSAKDVNPALNLSNSRLMAFILVLRNCYHPSNPYHNFIHAIDVMQATFYILIQIGHLPAFGKNQATAKPKALDPTKCTCLLIAALGHDAGHPGVTNNVLVSCNAPLARMYSGASVLESYHSAITREMINSYFPVIAGDTAMKNLVVDSILATDMAKHFQYMKWFEDPQSLWKQDACNLTGCMIIKCADISNVTRSRNISFYWGQLLAEEFVDISGLASSLGLDPMFNKDIETAKDDGDEEQKLAKNQVFFVKTYCLPLFEQLVKQFPDLHLLLDNLNANLSYWQKLVDDDDDDRAK